MTGKIQITRRPDARRIGVIADTHVPDRAADLHRNVFNAFKDVDLILHAGDISSPKVLDALSNMAECLAVRGNNAGDRRIQPPLLEKRIIEIADGFRIGLVHGVENSYQRVTDVMIGRSGLTSLCAHRLVRRVAPMFEDVNCIAYGHCHWPAAIQKQGRIFLNPGRAFAPRESACAVLHLDSDQVQVQFFPLGPSGKLTKILNKKYSFPILPNIHS